MIGVRARGVTALRYRRALVRTAVGAAAAGLPVVPGAWWSGAGRRFECDLPGCARTGPHPAVDAADVQACARAGLGAHAVRDPRAVAARWRRHPYSVLVPTGETCDVVDVPADLGRTLAVRLDLRGALGPLVAAGSRWFFLTAPGGRLPAQTGDVLVHGDGSWIMLPPTLGPAGEPAAWLAPPAPSARGGWRLPARDDVIGELLAVSLPRPPRPRALGQPGTAPAPRSGARPGAQGGTRPVARPAPRPRDRGRPQARPASA